MTDADKITSMFTSFYYCVHILIGFVYSFKINYGNYIKTTQQQRTNITSNVLWQLLLPQSTQINHYNCLPTSVDSSKCVPLSSRAV